MCVYFFFSPFYCVCSSLLQLIPTNITTFSLLVCCMYWTVLTATKQNRIAIHCYVHKHMRTSQTSIHRHTYKTPIMLWRNAFFSLLFILCLLFAFWKLKSVCLYWAACWFVVLEHYVVQMSEYSSLLLLSFICTVNLHVDASRMYYLHTYAAVMPLSHHCEIG